MTIQEVLQLEKVSASIKKIDLFLSCTSKDDFDYFQALAYKGIVLNEIGRVNEALKLLYAFVPYFNQLKSAEVICLCDAIIAIAKENSLFDQMLKYIEIKKKYLSMTDMSLYTIDLINYYIATNNSSKAKEQIEVLLAETLDSKTRYYYLDILANFYYKDHDYARFLDLYENLLEYLNINLMYEEANDLLLKNIKIEYESGNYIKALTLTKDLLEETNLTQKQKIIAATICVNAYTKNKEYRRATIIVSDYEEYLDGLDTKIQRPFVLAALQLYIEQNHIISIKEYEERLRAIDASKKEEIISKKKNKRISIPEIEEPITEDNNYVPEIGKIKVSIHQETEMKVSTAYEEFANVFSYINTRDKNLKFREFFRLGAIELCKLYDIEEIVLVYYNQGYLGFHYKTERVYNKKFSNDDLEDTILLSAIEQEKDIYLESEGLKNIINQKPFEEKQHILCFPIFEDTLIMGSIAYISKNRFIDQSFAFEMLKLITQMLNVRLNNELYLNKIESTNKKLFFISEAMSSGLKIENGDYVHSNTKACEILGIYENLYLSDFEARIEATDLANYRKKRMEAITNIASDIEAYYHYKKGDERIFIKERFYPMSENGGITLISLIDDISSEEKTRMELEALIYENPISKMAGQAKLFIDLENVLATKKFSLVIIDINDFKLFSDIYGYAFTSQMILKLGSLFKELILADFNTNVYHLDGDKFILLYKNINDKRLVISKTMNYLEKLEKEMYTANKRIKITFSAGVYRYTANQNITDLSKIISYASQGLLDAKEISDGKSHVMLFDQRTYQKRFFESQLITHISECIDHNKMSITYKQIVDLTQMDVYAFFARLNLVNYDVDLATVDLVIERRGLEDLLDKYLIQQVMMELKNFYNAKHAYLKICVPIHEKTLLNDTIIPFILTQFDFFRLPKENIIFLCNNSSKISEVAKKFVKNGLFIGSNQLELVYQDAITNFFIPYQKYKNGFTEIKLACNKRRIEIIVDDVNTKDDLKEQKELGTTYIFGNYYKKNIKMSDLINK